MDNEQQSNKAEDNRQPTGLSASSASAVAELTGVSAAKASRAEGTAGKGADQFADNKVGSDQANTESAASSDQALPSAQSEVSALKASLEQAIGELAAGKGDKTEVNELKAVLAQAIGKLESIVDQSDETPAAEAKAAEAPNSDEAVASADQASAPSADEPQAVKKAEAQADGESTPSADHASELAVDKSKAEEALSSREDQAFDQSQAYNSKSSKDSSSAEESGNKDNLTADPNLERKFKYAERCCGVGGSAVVASFVYLATYGQTCSDWQFGGAIFVGFAAAMLVVGAAWYIVRLMHENETGFSKLNAAKLAKEAVREASENDRDAAVSYKMMAETEAFKLLADLLRTLLNMLNHGSK